MPASRPRTLLVATPAGSVLAGCTDVNVVGVLRGSDPALRDEAVVVDAHLDHLGIARPVDGDSIFNGADDDASGSVAVLGVARGLARGPTPRWHPGGQPDSTRCALRGQ